MQPHNYPSPSSNLNPNLYQYSYFYLIFNCRFEKIIILITVILSFINRIELNQQVEKHQQLKNYQHPIYFVISIMNVTVFQLIHLTKSQSTLPRFPILNNYLFKD